MTMQFILMSNNTLQTIVKVFIRPKRELKLLEVQERLKNKKVQVQQEQVVSNQVFLEVEVEYLVLDLEIMK